MNKKFDTSVVIGRFSPPHFAHIELFKHALEISENLIIIIGSHDSPRSIKNPFTSKERMDMVLECFTLEEQKRIHFGFVTDTLYNEAEWIASVMNTVKGITYEIDEFTPYESLKIALVTHEKDKSTYYINYFKNWKIVDIGNKTNSDVVDNSVLSASKVRELYFEKYFNVLKSICPDPVIKFLYSFAKISEYATLKNEYDAAIKYDAQYENVPFGQVNFVTVDNIVIQSGHVLLIKRKNAPGRGLFGIPGGHLNINETFLEGALRELREETNIKVQDKVLKGSIFFDQIFDHPDRSLRGRTKKKIGRTITRVFGYKLDDSIDLPSVCAGDDASEVKWVTFDEVKDMRSLLFEDHFDIIIKVLNSL